MRLVTWNCCRGPYAARLYALRPLRFDVAVLQEFAQPTNLLLEHRYAWFGSNRNQGVAVVVRNEFTVERVESSRADEPSAYAARIRGPVAFNVLAVWSKPAPTYSRAVLHELDVHSDFLNDGPCVIAGDFNANSAPNARTRDLPFEELRRRLLDDFGLVSAYHEHTGEPYCGESRPTHYWRWNEKNPFHIDFCFIPQSWAQRISSVAVGSFADWSAHSDHRPVVVDVDASSLLPVEAGE